MKFISQNMIFTSTMARSLAKATAFAALPFLICLMLVAAMISLSSVAFLHRMPRLS